MNINSLLNLIGKMQREIDLTHEPNIATINDPLDLVFYSQLNDEQSRYQEALELATKARLLAEEKTVVQYAATVAGIYPKIRLDFNTSFSEEFVVIETVQHHLEQLFPKLTHKEQICFTYFKAVYYNFRAVHYYYTAQYHEAEHWLELSLDIWEELDDIFGKLQAYVNLTLIYTKLGKIEAALDYSDKVLEVVDPDIDPTGTCYTLISRAEIYELLADFNSAFNYLEQSYKLAIQHNHNQLIATTARSLAHIYWRMGNLKEVHALQDQVLDYYKSIDNPHFLSKIYNDLGNTKLHEKDYFGAKKYFLQSIKESKRIGFTDELIKSYYYLILADVEADHPSHDIALYLERMDEFISLSENPSNSDYHTLSKALLFKHQTRAYQKFKAIDLLMDLIHDKGVNFDVKITSIYHLAELLLIEYEFSKNQEILTDLDDILDRLLTIGNNINSRPLKIDYYLLYSKLLLQIGDTDSAIESLHKAQSLADLGKLSIVSSQIKWEINRINAEKEMMEDLNYISVPSHGDFEDIQRYIKELQKGKMPNLSQHLIDAPLMIMIISEGGLNLYAEQFASDITSELNLVASFITAIRSFTEEVFTSSSQLEKISMGHDDLLVMPVSNLHLCYMYQGYTPSAIDRLRIFTKTLEEHEMLLENLSNSALNKDTRQLLSQLTKIAFS